jgi:hypothetical protein
MMDMEKVGIPLREMRAFLDRLKSFDSEHADARLRYFQSGFARIKDKMESFASRRALSDLRESPRYDIFELLDVQTYERYTHSAFLSDLFNPEGSHGQGRLFLHALLKWLKESQRQTNITLPAGTKKALWYVETEKWTGDGSIDICLESFDPSLIVVIENKIRLGEQLDQISRYYRWARKRCKNVVVIYLTPNGDESHTSNGIQYVRMSYLKDITSILAATLEKVESPIVSATIKQYLMTIKNLKGVDSMTNDERGIVSYLTRRENLKYAIEVTKRIVEVKNGILWSFYSKIAERVNALMKKSPYARDWAVKRPSEDDSPDRSEPQIVFSQVKWSGQPRSICYKVAFDNGIYAGISCDSLSERDMKCVFKSKYKKSANIELSRRNHELGNPSLYLPVWAWIEIRKEKRFTDDTYLYVSSYPRAVKDIADKAWNLFW